MTDRTAADLSDRLAAEGLLSDAELTRARAIDSTDPAAWAKEIVEAGLLTRWQAARIVSGKGSLTLGPLVLLERIPILALSELFVARERNGSESRWIEVLPEGREVSEPTDLSAGDAVAVRSTTTIDGRVVIDHGPVAGQCSAQLIRKGVRWERPETAKLLRAACRALAPLHNDRRGLGRIAPTQFVRSNQRYRLATWGTGAFERTADDPFVAPELRSGDPPTPAGDVASLGTTALYLAFGTTTPSKVQAKSRLDQWLLKMVDADPSKRPTLDAVARAIDEWLAAKQTETEEPTVASADDGTVVGGDTTVSENSGSVTSLFGRGVAIESGSASSAPAPVLPEIVGNVVKVAALPSIAAEVRFAPAAGHAFRPEQVQLHRPEAKKRSLAMAIAIYAVVGVVTLAVTVAGLFWALQPETEVADAAKSDAAAIKPKDQGAAPAEPADGIAAANPAPLIAIDEPIIDVPTPPQPAGLPGGSLPAGAGVAGGNAGAPNEATPATEAGAEGNAPPVDVAQTDPAMPDPAMPDPAMPDPAMPAPTEPMPPTDGAAAPGGTEVATTPNPPATETPYVPAFRDLPKGVDLPIVGEGDWLAETDLGQIHLQPGDSIFCEFKGVAGAFRDTVTFEVLNADGGTAVNAFDIVAVEGTKRTKVGRLRVDGDRLKFAFESAAEGVPAANYLRNCHLRLRTGTDVGGLSLRMPMKLEALVMEDANLGGSSRTVLPFAPDTSKIEIRVLPLAETFPEYAFRDAVSTAKAQKGTVDIVLGGKYSASMFLQVGTTLAPNGRLDLKISAFSLIGMRVRPYRVKETQDALAAAQAVLDQANLELAQLAQIPAEQQGAYQNDIALRNVLKNEKEAEIKLAQDSLAFVESMKGQGIPVGVCYLADEYKVWLATPDGQPLD